MRFNGIKTREHHGFQGFEAGQGFRRGRVLIRNRVADLRVRNGSNIGEQESYFARGQFIGRNWFRRLIAHSVNFKLFAV